MAVAEVDDKIVISFSVTDRHATADWYEKMLGFKLMFHADEAGWSELATNSPGVTIGLGEQVEATPGNAVPVFGVAEIGTARTALEGAGVRFDGETVTIPGMVSMASFYDPDGNALMIAQDLMQDG